MRVREKSTVQLEEELVSRASRAISAGEPVRLWSGGLDRFTHLGNAALDIHAYDTAFGYRFITDELPGKGAVAVRAGSSAYAGATKSGRCSRRSLALNRSAGPSVQEDVVERNVIAAASNELWLTGITEHPTAEGKVYRCWLEGPQIRQDRRVPDGFHG